MSISRTSDNNASPDGERRRQEILTSARQLFLEHGFHGTTTRMIARKAQTSDALLYRYFPSKQNLFDAVINEGLSHLEPYLRFGAPHLAGLRLRETLEAAAYTTVEIARRDIDVFRLLVAQSQMLANDRRIPEVIDGLLRHFAARINDFVAAGEARPCNTTVFARQFIGGIAMFDLANTLFDPTGHINSNISIDEYITEVVDAAQRSLKPDA